MECEIRVDGARLEQDEDVFESRRKVAIERVPSDPWLRLGVYNLSVRGLYMRDCSCLFCCMAVRE